MQDVKLPDTPITNTYPGLNNLVVDFNQMKSFLDDPLVLVEGDGVRVRDHTGRWYIDGLAGVAAVQLGHRNEGIIEAMRAQLDRIALAPAPLCGVRAGHCAGRAAGRGDTRTANPRQVHQRRLRSQ